MRPAGRFVADVLARLAAAADVGVNLLELDALAHELIRERGAESLLHRLPPVVRRDAVRQGAVHLGQRRGAARAAARLRAAGRRPAQPRLRGLASTAGSPTRRVSVVVGTPREEDLRAHRHDASARSTPASRPRSRATGSATSRPRSATVARAAGYAINTDFGGHGVGRTMHGDPHVPNDGRAGPRLPAPARAWSSRSSRGSCRRTDEIYTDPDGWTLRSADGSRGAHSEHTIAITEDGPLVLTARG